MSWTKQLPKESGYYWMHWGDSTGMEIVDLDLDDEFGNSYWLHRDDCLYKISDYEYHWWDKRIEKPLHDKSDVIDFSDDIVD